MATAAQIEANRRNSAKSTGPRTEHGKHRSRLNALDHGGRANLLVLPTEEFGEFENERLAWRMSFRPRNLAEEVLVDRLVSLAWQEKRIDRAQTARLTRRIDHAGIEEGDQEQEQVLDLGQRLFRDSCGPAALYLERNSSELRPEDEESIRVSDYSDEEEHPMRLVHRLQSTLAGCEWLLEQWARLRDLLEQGLPWLASDKLKAVRLLGRHPIDAFDARDVARVYLASQVLLNPGGQPFQEILNELLPDEVPAFASFCERRGFAALAPQDAAAARVMLLDVVDRATPSLENKAGVLRELAEIDAQSAAERLSWDDTPEGERLRRYELTCKRTWLRMFELLLKTRQTGGALDIAAIPSIGRFIPSVMTGEIAAPVPAVATGGIAAPAPAVASDVNPPEVALEQPDPPNEANSERENAPNEANSGVQEITGGRPDGQKEFRIDTPHRGHEAGGPKIGGKPKSHPALDRVLGSPNSTLLNLSGIFGER